MSSITLHHGDCREVMAGMEPASIGAIVTDPPYGIGFMGKGWDHGVPGVPFWSEALRVLKPGGHLLAFGGTRTYHRLACAIEDAGFEVRDCLMWLYGSGFPKSLDVSKAIDKAAGARRGEERPHPTNQCKGGQWCECNALDATGRFSPTKHSAITAPATDAAKQWHGYGTALKPAWEPIIVARKPLSGTVAANVQQHGTGALNVDGCRVPCDDKAKFPVGDYGDRGIYGANGNRSDDPASSGRWPANLLLDEEAAAALGEPSRFYYCAKASKADRDEGLDDLPDKTYQTGCGGDMPLDDRGVSRDRFKAVAKNHHPTVKPTSLMRWLVKLVTPPAGVPFVVLDPFTGSGSTGKACALEGVDFVGIEQNQEYLEIARRRCRQEPSLF